MLSRAGACVMSSSYLSRNIMTALYGTSHAVEPGHPNGALLVCLGGPVASLPCNLLPAIRPAGRIELFPCLMCQQPLNSISAKQAHEPLR